MQTIVKEMRLVSFSRICLWFCFLKGLPINQRSTQLVRLPRFPARRRQTPVSVLTQLICIF